MDHSDDRSRSENALSDQLPISATESRISSEILSFLPSHHISEAEARKIMEDGDPDLRRAFIAELISYAPWDEIWTYISRDELKEVLPDLELPESLAESWQRFLL